MELQTKPILFICTFVFVGVLIFNAAYYNRPQGEYQFQRTQGYVWEEKIRGRINIKIKISNFTANSANWTIELDENLISNVTGPESIVSVNTNDYSEGWHTIQIRTEDGQIHSQQPFRIISIQAILINIISIAMIVFCLAIPIIIASKSPSF